MRKRPVDDQSLCARPAERVERLIPDWVIRPAKKRCRPHEDFGTALARPGGPKVQTDRGQPASKGTVSANTVFCFGEMTRKARIDSARASTHARGSASKLLSPKIISRVAIPPDIRSMLVDTQHQRENPPGLTGAGFFVPAIRTTFQAPLEPPCGPFAEAHELRQEIPGGRTKRPGRGCESLEPSSSNRLWLVPFIKRKNFRFLESFVFNDIGDF